MGQSRSPIIDFDAHHANFHNKGFDENHKPFKDPLYVPVGPITKARSKKIKEALNGLILTQDIPSLAQRKIGRAHV